MIQILQLLPSVEVDDLPALLKYLMTNCNHTNAAHMVDSIRKALHFVNPTDPRLPGEPCWEIGGDEADGNISIYLFRYTECVLNVGAWIVS
jgi:hypothetical protein